MKKFLILFFLFNLSYALDTTFNKTGKLVLNLGKFSIANAVTQIDGKILLAGVIDTQFALVKLNQDGSYDKTFGKQGIVIIPASQKSFLNSMVIDNNKRIIVTGSIGDNYAIIRLNPNGSLDKSFGQAGKKIFKFGISISANSVQLLNNKILVGGNSYFRYINLILLDEHGNFDSQFNYPQYGPGRILLQFSALSECKGVAVQEDDKILVVGNVSGFFIILRFNQDGTLDLNFGPFGTGSVPIVSGQFASANAVALQRDKKILVGGVSDFKFVVARLLADGTLDRTFNKVGFVETKINQKAAINAIALQPWDDKIVVAGYALDNLYQFTLARYNTDGTLDTIIQTDFGNNYLGNGAQAVFVDSVNKKIIAAGYAGKHMAVARYNANCKTVHSIFINALQDKYN